MSKKDYIIIAGVIKNSIAELQEKRELLVYSREYEKGKDIAFNTLIYKMIIELQNENARFQAEKFTKYINN